MTGADVRWKQCLTCYVGDLALLQDALKAGVEPLNSLEKDGTVQRFGFTRELGWSVIRDCFPMRTFGKTCSDGAAG